jgi:phosphoglycerate dehydrogenase-like enzyme
MKILFGAYDYALGGFMGLMKKELPQHEFQDSGRCRIESLKGFDVLLPIMNPVSRELLDSGDCLRLIQQCGAGLESVDIHAARGKNIWVANVPTDISGNADSVAELGIYLMVGLARDFRKMAHSIKNRQFGFPGRALSGKTVGLVGIGGIGRAMARRLKAFDVHLIGIKRHNLQETKEDLGLEWVGTPDDMKEFLGRADYVILCLPVTPESRNLINQQTLNEMKQNAFLINLSRGGLVDRDALEEALAMGKIAGAGLDVFWEEPPDPDDSIFQYNVMATPHIAGATDISIRGILKVVVENIRRLERGEVPLYLKN